MDIISGYYKTENFILVLTFTDCNSFGIIKQELVLTKVHHVNQGNFETNIVFVQMHQVSINYDCSVKYG